MNTTFERLLVLTGMLIGLSGCVGAHMHDSLPIEGWVTDAQTGEPIEGAIVVANWQLVVGGLDGPSERGQLELKETVTDSTGRFYFDGFSKQVRGGYEIRQANPRLIIFNPGYDYLVRYDARKIYGNSNNPETDFPREYRVIKLKNLTPQKIGTRNFYYVHLNIRMEGLVEKCGWEKIPKAILAMDSEAKRIAAMGPNSIADIDTIERLESRYGNDMRCKSPVEFFQNYAK